MTITDRRSFLHGSLALGSAVAATMTADAEAQPRGRPRVRAISAMTFADDGKLIVADWRSGALYALALPAMVQKPLGSFNVVDLDAAFARTRALMPLRVSAAALHRESGQAVLAVAFGGGEAPAVRLASVGQDGQITLMDPSRLVTDAYFFDDAPGEGVLWESNPVRSLTVTDIKARGAELLVAGLSNADFSSTLRRVPYPFASSGPATAIEMYHAVHNQIETRAPVRAMAVVPLDGEDHLLAVYTCTPLVTAPLAALRPGASVRAKTIAELGYGNTPLDVIPFAIEYQGARSQWVIVANAARTADLLPLEAIAAANRKPGLSTPVRAPFETQAGLSSIQAPISNLVKLMDQDDAYLLALRRDSVTGALQLVSIRKGAFFRLSDHVNEYDFPNYQYPPGDRFQQDFIRPFHRLLRQDEGFPGLVK